MMDNSTTVARFNLNGKPVYVQCEWKCNANDLFYIKIFNETGVWKGRYSQEFAKNYKENIDESDEQYYRTIKDALRGKDNSFKFEFSSQISQGNAIQAGGDARKFVWKKTFQDGAELVYGAVPVHFVEDLSLFSLIDYLLQENTMINSTLAEFERKYKIISDDLEKCNKCLDKYVTTKDSLESHLYGRFVQLLNAKKKRIDILENSIQMETQFQDKYNEVD